MAVLFDLTGQVALVSGAPGPLATELERHGARVHLVAPPSTQDAAQAAVADCLAEYGQLDILVNAGRPVAGPGFAATDDADLIAAWDAVVVPALCLTQAALPQLRSQGYGRVVLVGDPAGLLYGHADSHTGHDLAMGALSAMMRTLNPEGLDAGVRTNAVLAVTEPDDPAVLATALWLAGPGCEVSGRFLAAGDGRVAEVFAYAGRGYQSPRPSEFSIEETSRNWDVAVSYADGIAPVNQVEYNGFRTETYRAHVLVEEGAGNG